ncbi:MAG: class I SAM-dependent methyltransferase [bacterium]|nr:class I SAM-dependent methyltransferase [bacterium]
MKLSRATALKIHYLLDQCLPPFLRDSRWFMRLPFHFLYKDRAETFLTFKEKVYDLSEEAFVETYRFIEPVLMERATDLTAASEKAILSHLLGSTVLEVGCGKGLLAKQMADTGRSVSGIDIVIDPSLRARYPQIQFFEGAAECLPFDDGTFDTVVCAHTLEHVRQFHQSLRELRRVAKRRLIIIVPKQRPYRFTFDLHLRFFPYPHSFLAAVGGSGTCRDVGGDLFYVEERSATYVSA